MAVTINGSTGITTNGISDTTGTDALNNVTVAGTLAVTGNSTFTGTITGSSTVAGATGTLYPLVSGTVQATTSGTSITFTGIPSWVKRITVMIAGVSTAATSNYLIQLVTGGGTVSSGYNSGANGGTAGVATATATNGFLVSGTLNANDIQGGVVTICNVTSNIWCYSSVLNTASSTGRFQSAGGNVNAGAAVTGLIFTTVAGSTFTAGNVNILYE